MPVMLACAIVVAEAGIGMSGAQSASSLSAFPNNIVAAKSPTPTKKPKPTATPTATPTPGGTSSSSLELQGQGALVPSGSCFCADASVLVGCFCPGTFTSSLTGPPFGQIDLNFDLSVDLSPFTSGPNCYRASGGGQFGATGNQNNGSTIGFTGEICAASYIYTMQGTLEIFPDSALSDAADRDGGNAVRLRGGPPIGSGAHIRAYAGPCDQPDPIRL